ncbi:hypothetical protein G7Y89_g7330 [Cudoniella acicularis]|uniref:Uncharacterized protein n=1 Tax=Cudoniella acicularis TaxID=354080 RepID=A0A8H4RJJ6_9HELO|nr:hypothetical protein G7Y89_g7330 [Cudoniella acicularis]
MVSLKQIGFFSPDQASTSITQRQPQQTDLRQKRSAPSKENKRATNNSTDNVVSGRLKSDSKLNLLYKIGTKCFLQPDLDDKRSLRRLAHMSGYATRWLIDHLETVQGPFKSFTLF